MATNVFFPCSPYPDEAPPSGALDTGVAPYLRWGFGRTQPENVLLAQSILLCMNRREMWSKRDLASYFSSYSHFSFSQVTSVPSVPSVPSFDLERLFSFDLYPIDLILLPPFPNANIIILYKYGPLSFVFE